ncbi:helix-turn-helix domain-containing protein, partial [Streptomyces sp. NPDC047028]
DETVPGPATEPHPAAQADETVPGPATEPHPAAQADETVPGPATEPHPATVPGTKTARGPESAAAPPVPPAPVREAPPSPSRDLGPREHRHDMAVGLLAGLRRTDSRLSLSHRQVNALAPAVVAWLDRGVARAEIYRTLVTGLPAEMKYPAGVLAYRLRELLPPYLPALPERRPEREPRVDDGPQPFQTCDGCERAFRSPAPGRCRDCRPAPAATSEVACAA